MSSEQVIQLKVQNQALLKRVESLRRANYIKWAIIIAGGVTGLASLAMSITSVVIDQSALSWSSFGVATASIGISTLGLFSECFTKNHSDYTKPNEKLKKAEVDRIKHEVLDEDNGVVLGPGIESLI